MRSSSNDDGEDPGDDDEEACDMDPVVETEDRLNAAIDVASVSVRTLPPSGVGALEAAVMVIGGVVSTAGALAFAAVTSLR